MNNPSGNHKLRADVIVIVSLLLLALVLYLALGSFPLNGGTNILVIEDGYAWMSEANCPDHICVRQGKIHYTGQVITCLPNRLTVTIEGGEDGGVDLIVG